MAGKSGPTGKGPEKRAGKAEGQGGPDIQAILEARRAAVLELIRRQPRLTGFLDRLAADPPQSLLLEGGQAAEREALALYYAARLNCSEATSDAATPACLECPACRQIIDEAHSDLHVVRLQAKKLEISVAQAREVRQIAGLPPRSGRYRVIIFQEARRLTEEAANALLKTLEDPRPGNVFVLCAPRREQLFPTLVSRSFVLTLRWPGRGASAVPPLPASPARLDEEQSEEAESAKVAASGEFPDIQALLERFHVFLESGKGWFELTGRKGAIDRETAREFVAAMRRGLTDMALSGGDLATLARVRRLTRVADAAEEALEAQVNPALALEWAAVASYFRRS